MKLNQTGNIDIVSIVRPSISEFFIQAQCTDQQAFAASITELAAFLEKKHARVVSFRLFVRNGSFETANAAIHTVIGHLDCPTVWISQPNQPQIPLASFQVHAVSGVPIEPIKEDSIIKGCRFADEHNRYCLLHIPAPKTDHNGRFQAAKVVFDAMQEDLQTAGLDFSRTVRTWLFADDILSWYDQLNRARDDFFEQHDIFNQLVPASTGVGVANPYETAMTTELLALQPLDGQVSIRKIVSPLQCEALDYKSSFSRAVLVESPDHRRMYVSGTASIDPDGKTAFLDDCDKQIELTMQVAEALIGNGSMTWQNCTRAIAYFKDCHDFDCFDRFCRNKGLNLPHIKVEADVCRDDLLFELELDLISVSS